MTGLKPGSLSALASEVLGRLPLAEALKDHPVARLLRHDLPDELRERLADL